MSELPVFRPTNCAVCKANFYAPTEWVDGHRIPTVTTCGDCSSQGGLFGGAA